MKKKIVQIIGLLIVISVVVSCYKETERDLEIFNNESNSPSVFVPDTFHSPCDNSIDINTVVFDGQKYNFNNVGWTLTTATNYYCIEGETYYDEAITIIFNTNMPKVSKIYDVTASGYNDNNSVHITYRDGPIFGLGTSIYESTAQGKLYLNILGDSISATFCDITFNHETYTSITRKASSKITWKE